MLPLVSGRRTDPRDAPLPCPWGAPCRPRKVPHQEPASVVPAGTTFSGGHLGDRILPRAAALRPERGTHPQPHNISWHLFASVVLQSSRDPVCLSELFL